MSAADVAPATGVALPEAPDVRDTSWRGLVVQPLVVLLALLAYVVWFRTADLTPTEESTLNSHDLLDYTLQHLSLTFVSAVIVIVVMVPLGILLTRRPIVRASGVVLAVANVGQAAPAIGLVVLLAFWLGFSYWTAVVALVIYAALPVLRNTMLGIQSVDPVLVEAARGMGMSSFRTLMNIELPLAVPIMLAGIRTALVLLAGSAALATFIGGGGLGLLITTGVNLFLPRVLISGALLIALLALMVDWLGRLVEHVARPKGLS